VLCVVYCCLLCVVVVCCCCVLLCVVVCSCCVLLLCVVVVCCCVVVVCVVVVVVVGASGMRWLSVLVVLGFFAQHGYPSNHPRYHPGVPMPFYSDLSFTHVANDNRFLNFTGHGTISTDYMHLKTYITYAADMWVLFQVSCRKFALFCLQFFLFVN